jgi:hypothetical protein
MTRWLIVFVWGSLATTVVAQTSYPMLMGLKPIAVQQGTSSECEVHSRYTMLGAHTVFVSGEGVTAEVVPPQLPELKPGETHKEIANLKLKFTVTTDALPGPREFRIATPNGASTIGQLVVVRDPVIVEPAENDTADKAFSVTLPAVLCGTIEKGEDFDFWKFAAAEGESLSMQVRCCRLQDKIHDLQVHADPILFLRDATGSVLAMSDNAQSADPFLTHTFRAAGEYLLELRDVRYQGNPDWQYAIEVHNRPVITQVSPLAIAADIETPAQLAGFHLGEDRHSLVAVAGPPLGRRWVTLPYQNQRTNPVPVYVTDLPRFEEPAGENNAVGQGVPITLPVVINGRIEQPSDLDLYAFDASVGTGYSIEVLARRYGSNLDPYVRILNDQGHPQREEDDSYHGKHHNPDALIEGWYPPATGKYLLEIRDVHLRGGDGFAYGLRVVPSRPMFELQIDSDKTQLTPGTHNVIFVRTIRRHGFTGEITLHVDGLPPGVTATVGRILAGKGQDAAIILSAAPDAPLSMQRLTIRGTATHPQGEGMSPLELSAVAAPYQEIYMPGGGRSHFLADDHVVCVGSPLDVRAVTLSETDIRLKPGESRTIQVKIDRAPNVTANISLDFYYQHLGQIFANTLPEGVTIDAVTSKTLLAGGASEGSITLKAAADAPKVERQVCSLMANFSINFVMKATYSSPPVFVSVVE